MPTGTTSNRSRSRWRSTLPAETHEMACSLLRPPNTTATRMRPVTGAERRGSLVVETQQAQVGRPEGARVDEGVDEIAPVGAVVTGATRLGHEPVDALGREPLAYPLTTAARPSSGSTCRAR